MILPHAENSIAWQLRSYTDTTLSTDLEIQLQIKGVLQSWFELKFSFISLV